MAQGVACHRVIDTYGVPPVEQTAQLILQSRQALKAGSFLRHNGHCLWRRMTCVQEPAGLSARHDGRAR
jgi:hypothetical protein